MDTVFADKRGAINGVLMYVTTSAVSLRSELSNDRLCNDDVITGTGFYECNQVGQYLYLVQDPGDTGYAAGFTLCGLDVLNMHNLIALELTWPPESNLKATVSCDD